MNLFNHSTLLRLSIIFLTLALSGVCVVTSAFWPGQAAQTAISPAKINTVQDTTVPLAHKLIVKEHNGKICVYSDEVLMLETDIPIASLPEQDRIALTEGIVIESDEDLQHLLEDFGA